jgi:hypothetical protein
MINKFKKKYQNSIKFDYHTIYNNAFRKTSFHDAIIDIYMSVYSNDFKGSGYSIFSDLIIQLRKYKSL